LPPVLSCLKFGLSRAHTGTAGQEGTGRGRVMQTTVTSRVAYNTVVQFAGKLITSAVGIVTLGLLTRYLGVAGYGEYTTIFAFLGFFAVVADFGLFPIVVRDIARHPEDRERIFGNVLTLRIMLAAGILVLAAVVALFIPKYNFDIKAGIAIGAFASFFLLLNQTLAGVFQAYLRMDKFVVVETAGRLLILALIVYCIREELGLLTIIAVNGIGNLAAFLLSTVLVRSFLKVRLRFDGEYLKRLIPEVLPLFGIIVLGVVYFRTDQIILSLVWGSWEVGVYGVPYKIVELLATLPAVFANSVLPVVSKYLVDRDSRLFEGLQRAFDFVGLIALPIVVGIFVVAPSVISIFAGADFSLSVPLLRILILSAGLIFFCTLFGNIVIAAGLQRHLVKIYAVGAVANVVLNLIFIPLYSVYAAAVISVITQAWACGVSYLVLRRQLEWRPRLDYLLKAGAAALLMGVAVWFFREQGLLVRIGIGVAVYCVLSFLTGVVSKETVRRVLGMP
jgi:O-antigen/teichoic acid export membrane protein